MTEREREESHQEYVTLRDYMESRLESIERATEVAVAAANRAMEKAEIANNARFAQVNEFRQALADQTREYLPRNEWGVQHTALIDRISAMERAMVHATGRTAGIGGLGSVVLGAFVIVTALSALGSLLLVVFHR